MINAVVLELCLIKLVLYWTIVLVCLGIGRRSKVFDRPSDFCTLLDTKSCVCSTRVLSIRAMLLVKNIAQFTWSWCSISQWSQRRLFEDVIILYVACKRIWPGRNYTETKESSKASSLFTINVGIHVERVLEAEIDISDGYA